MSDLLHQFISGYHQAVRTLRREVLDATPGQWRLAADTVARLYIPPRDLIVEPHERQGLPGELVRRKSVPDSAAAIVWIPGGGFAFGPPRTHRAAAAALSKATQRPVWIPHYPLAPEHPHPAALDALDRAGADEPMDIVGDSAGGNLALCWALRRKRGDRLILLSPWLDLRVDGPSAQRNESRHSAFDREDLREYASLYLARKPFREVRTKFHLLHPWWIPVKLIGEIRALISAWSLSRRPSALLSPSTCFPSSH